MPRPRRQNFRTPKNPDAAELKQAEKGFKTTAKNLIAHELRRNTSIPNADNAAVHQKELESEAGKKVTQAAAKLEVQERKLLTELERLRRISESTGNTDRSKDLEAIRAQGQTIETEMQATLANLRSALASLLLAPELKTIIETVLQEKQERAEKASKELTSNLRSKEHSFAPHKRESIDHEKMNVLDAPTELLGKLQELAKREPQKTNWLARPQSKKTFQRYEKELSDFEKKRANLLIELSQAVANGERDKELDTRNALRGISARSAIILHSLQEELRLYKKPPQGQTPLSTRKAFEEDELKHDEPIKWKDPVLRAKFRKFNTPQERNKAIDRALTRQVSHCLEGSRERVKFRQENFLSHRHLPHLHPELNRSIPYPRGYQFEETLENLDFAIKRFGEKSLLYDQAATEATEGWITTLQGKIDSVQKEIKQQVATRGRFQAKTPQEKSNRAFVKKLKTSLKQERAKLKRMKSAVSDEDRASFFASKITLYQNFKEKVLVQQKEEQRAKEAQDKMVQASKDLAQLVEPHLHEFARLQDTLKFILSDKEDPEFLSTLLWSLDLSSGVQRLSFFSKITRLRGEIREARLTLAATSKATPDEFKAHATNQASLLKDLSQAVGQEQAKTYFAHDAVQAYLQSILPPSVDADDMFAKIQPQLSPEDFRTPEDVQEEIFKILEKHRSDFAISHLALAKHLPKESIESPETDQEFFKAAKQWFEHAKQYYEQCGDKGKELFTSIEAFFSTPPAEHPIDPNTIGQILSQTLALETYLLQKVGAAYPKISEYTAKSYGYDEIQANQKQLIEQELADVNSDQGFANLTTALNELRTALNTLPALTGANVIADLDHLIGGIDEEHFTKVIQSERAIGRTGDDGVQRGVKRGDPELTIEVLIISMKCLEQLHTSQFKHLAPTATGYNELKAVAKALGLSHYLPIAETGQTYTQEEVIARRLVFEVEPLFSALEQEIAALKDDHQPIAKLLFEQLQNAMDSIKNGTPLDQIRFDWSFGEPLMNLQFFFYDLENSTGQNAIQTIIAQILNITSLSDHYLRTIRVKRVDELASISEANFNTAVTNFFKIIPKNAKNPIYKELDIHLAANNFVTWGDPNDPSYDDPVWARECIFYAIRYLEHEQDRGYIGIVSRTGDDELWDLAAALGLSSYIDCYRSNYTSITFIQSLLETSHINSMKAEFPDATDEIDDLFKEYHDQARSIERTRKSMYDLHDTYRQKFDELRTELRERPLKIEKAARESSKNQYLAELQAEFASPTTAKAGVKLEKATLSPEVLPKLQAAEAKAQAEMDRILDLYIENLADDEKVADKLNELNSERDRIIDEFRNTVSDINAEDQALKLVETNKNEIEAAKNTLANQLSNLEASPVTTTDTPLDLAVLTEAQKKQLASMQQKLRSDYEHIIKDHTNIPKGKGFDSTTLEAQWNLAIDDYKQQVTEIHEAPVKLKEAFRDLHALLGDILTRERLFFRDHNRTDKELNQFLENPTLMEEWANLAIDSYAEKFNPEGTETMNYLWFTQSEHFSVLEAYLSAIGQRLENFWPPPPPEPPGGQESSSPGTNPTNTNAQENINPSESDAGAELARLINEEEARGGIRYDLDEDFYPEAYTETQRQQLRESLRGATQEVESAIEPEEDEQQPPQQIRRAA